MLMLSWVKHCRLLSSNPDSTKGKGGSPRCQCEHGGRAALTHQGREFGPPSVDESRNRSRPESLSTIGAFPIQGRSRSWDEGIAFVLDPNVIHAIIRRAGRDPR